MIRLPSKVSGWVIASGIGVAIILLPTLYILLNLFHPSNENWQHIKEYLLADYIFNSLTLAIGATVSASLIGVTLAWIVVAYDFPMKRFFRLAFILPLAIPPYIAAYTYSGMLGYTGFIQTFLRSKIDTPLNPAFFDMMSRKGAIFIFTLFLFPYVYVITKAFLERQSASFIESAQLLGKNSLQTFLQVVIPLSRTAIVGGASLVALEVLSDYGVTNYFGIHTFSTAIFQTWFGMYDIESAIKLAAMLMSVVLFFLLLEKFLRGRKSFHSSTSKVRPLTPKKLVGWKRVGVLFFCSIIFSFSFLIPFLQLLVWGTLTYQDVLNSEFIHLIGNTIFVAGIASTIIILFAVIVANVCRIYPSTFSKGLTKIISLGYSLPGAVLAIGVMTLFIALDRQLGGIYQMIGFGDKTLVLSMSLVMIIFAYVIRFLTIGFNSVEAGFEKIGTTYLEASRLLGMNVTKSFFKVDLPMMKGAIISGFILTFVDILKELPLALLLRPFNFETLATKTYQFAGDERIHEASIPSLFIITISIVSIYFFHRLGEKRNS